MNKRILTIAILLIIAGSVSLNIYLIVKNNELNNRINAFIPQAVSLQDENSRLFEKAKSQQQQIDDCNYYKDSLQQEKKKPVQQTMIPQHDTLPENMQPNDGRMFKDLNKGM